MTLRYTYDANGQVTQITDGLSNNAPPPKLWRAGGWTKAYDGK